MVKIKKYLIQVLKFFLIAESSVKTYYAIAFLVVMSAFLSFSALKAQDVNRALVVEVSKNENLMQKKISKKNILKSKYDSLIVSENSTTLTNSLATGWKLNPKKEKTAGYIVNNLCLKWLNQNPLKYNEFKEIDLHTNIKLKSIDLSFDKSEICVVFLSSDY